MPACGQLVQNLCLAWAQDIGVPGLRSGDRSFGKKYLASYGYERRNTLK
jgi:hypothetical protein